MSTRNCIEYTWSSGELCNLVVSNTANKINSPFKALHDIVEASKLRDRHRVPEPFLWSVFERLTNACLLMERGSVNDWSAVPDWQLIVHRDLRVANGRRARCCSLESKLMFSSVPWPQYQHVQGLSSTEGRRFRPEQLRT